MRFIKERKGRENLARMARERDKRQTPSSMYNAQIKNLRTSRSVFTNRKSQMTRKDIFNYLKTKPLPAGNVDFFISGNSDGFRHEGTTCQVELVY